MLDRLSASEYHIGRFAHRAFSGQRGSCCSVCTSCILSRVLLAVVGLASIVFFMLLTRRRSLICPAPQSTPSPLPQGPGSPERGSSRTHRCATSREI